MHRAKRPFQLRRIAFGLAALLALAVIGTASALYAQGYRAYVVHTGSMSPTYRPGSLVIDRPADGRYHRGEVITFRHSEGNDDLVTHRVVAVTPQGIHTKGDANRTPDVWTIPADQVRGSVIGGMPYLGFLMVYLQQPRGVASVATISISLVLLWGLFFAPHEASATNRREPRPATI
ncbi:MAG TPA: signal peptidase I [Jatrophihabitantaceae bacterium]|jgi:signal peptidase|nr:signal peptidase I [Jatrophihabitantaceae bacterium]